MAETLVERVAELEQALKDKGLFYAGREQYILGTRDAHQQRADRAEARIKELERQLAEAERQARIFYALSEERGRTIEATRLQLETARQQERRQCAKVCDDADKSTHPSDLADAIRAREGE